MLCIGKKKVLIQNGNTDSNKSALGMTMKNTKKKQIWKKINLNKKNELQQKNKLWQKNKIWQK